jgi:hypothetical protein
VVDTLLNWLLRGALALFAAGAAVALLRWMRAAAAERREKWAVRIGWGMIVLAAAYAGGHVWILAHAAQIEEGRMAYRRFGDPRETERTRAEVRGWILDCSARPENALARYARVGDVVERMHTLGDGGANFIGGGEGADERDFTVERLFAADLRRPPNFVEAGELHPVGTDLPLTLCAEPTARAWQLLRETGRPGAVVVQDVRTGALVTYVASGGPDQAPYGIRRYAPPGSVFKLALAALWWENGLGDRAMGCPSSIQVGRATISNYESGSYPSLEVPREMLVVSCNTAAVRMALEMRQQIGADRYAQGLRRLGFVTYDDQPPAAFDREFWNTENGAWARRMSPPSIRVRILPRLNEHEWGQIAIGQGPVDVTPIGVSRFIQSIGNGGVMLPVTLEQSRLADVPEGQRVMSDGTSQRLQRAMAEVVQRGTARSAYPRLQGTGWMMGGKTGSADVRRGQRADGWFAGLMYDGDGAARYTVVVYLQGGAPGGRMPSAVAAEMTRHMAARDAAEAEAEAAEAEAP